VHDPGTPVARSQKQFPVAKLEFGPVSLAARIEPEAGTSHQMSVVMRSTRLGGNRASSPAPLA
jgi:hypothetical protein